MINRGKSKIVQIAELLGMDAKKSRYLMNSLRGLVPMTKRKTNRRDATGEKEERGPHKVRLVLDIMDRISALTPREIIEMPYETLREVMYFLGLDPDKPLSDDILCLIDKLQSEKARRPGLRLMVKEDEAEQMRLSADENRDRPPFFHQPGVEVGG